VPEHGNITLPNGSSVAGEFIEMDLASGEVLRKLFVHPNGTHEKLDI
jgi:hypothetical protein